MIYDSTAELHVMIQHVDQGLARQRVFQKYCSETETRQQRGSITAELHIVHSGIAPAATACYLTTSQQNNPAALLHATENRIPLPMQTYYLQKKKKNRKPKSIAVHFDRYLRGEGSFASALSYFNIAA